MLLVSYGRNKDYPFSKIFESMLGFLEAFVDRGIIVSYI